MLDFYRLSLTRYLILLDSTEFYWVLLGYIGLYWVLLSFTEVIGGLIQSTLLLFVTARFLPFNETQFAFTAKLALIIFIAP